MQYAYLGLSGLKVSRLCFGTMNFGEMTDAPASFQILDAVLEAGINFVDTADVYGGPQSPDMRRASVSPKRSSGAGWPIAAAATTSCSRPRSTSRWASARTTAGFRCFISDVTGPGCYNWQWFTHFEHSTGGRQAR